MACVAIGFKDRRGHDPHQIANPKTCCRKADEAMLFFLSARQPSVAGSRSQSWSVADAFKRTTSVLEQELSVAPHPSSLHHASGASQSTVSNSLFMYVSHSASRTSFSCLEPLAAFRQYDLRLLCAAARSPSDAVGRRAQGAREARMDCYAIKSWSAGGLRYSLKICRHVPRPGP